LYIKVVFIIRSVTEKSHLLYQLFVPNILSFATEGKELFYGAYTLSARVLGPVAHRRGR